MRMWAVCIGLLAGCPSVDLGNSPVDVGQCNPEKGEAYFESTIWPVYLNGAGSAQCTRGGCHEPAGTTGMRFLTTPIDYQANYKIAVSKINCDDPEASPFLQKPLAGVEPHTGGDIFQTTDDPAVQAFLAWFEP